MSSYTVINPATAAPVTDVHLASVDEADAAIEAAHHAFVGGWRDLAPGTFCLPHPSWRNTAWLKANPFYAQEVLPALRARVREVLNA